MRQLLPTLLFASLMALAAIGCGNKNKPSPPPGDSPGDSDDSRRPTRFRGEDDREADKPVAAMAGAEKKAAPEKKAVKPAPRGLIQVVETSAKISVPKREKDGKPIANDPSAWYVQAVRTYDTTTRYTVFVSWAYQHLSVDEAKELIAFIDKLKTVKQAAPPDPVKDVSLTVNWGSMHPFYFSQGEWRRWVYDRDRYVRAADIKTALLEALATLEKIRKTKPSVEW